MEDCGRADDDSVLDEELLPVMLPPEIVLSASIQLFHSCGQIGTQHCCLLIKKRNAGRTLVSLIVSFDRIHLLARKKMLF